MIHVQTFLPVKHWRQSFTTFSNIVSMQENVFFFLIRNKESCYKLILTTAHTSSSVSSIGQTHLDNTWRTGLPGARGSTTSSDSCSSPNRGRRTSLNPERP